MQSCCSRDSYVLSFSVQSWEVIGECDCKVSLYTIANFLCLHQMPPDWFHGFISATFSNHTVKVAGKNIHYRRWPGEGVLQKPLSSLQKPLKALPGLLFVHGYGAHSHWWDFIAPAFIEDFDVVAMDMSGAGDSEHRDIYRATTFAGEIIAVCKDARLQSAVVVGHSFGGSMTRVAAYLSGEELAGAILVDTMLSRHRGKHTPPPKPRSHIRYYDSLAAGVKRFRLRPPQPCSNQYILDYIARHSLAEGEDGYYFKLDQSLFSKMQEDFEAVSALTMIAQSRCPVGIIYGQNSRLFPPESVEILEEVIRADLIHCIPDSHHHVFLDQPLAFIDALKVLLPRLRNR